MSGSYYLLQDDHIMLHTPVMHGNKSGEIENDIYCGECRHAQLRCIQAPYACWHSAAIKQTGRQKVGWQVAAQQSMVHARWVAKQRMNFWYHHYHHQSPTTHNNNNNNHLMALHRGQPRWAGTRTLRNINPIYHFKFLTGHSQPYLPIYLYGESNTKRKTGGNSWKKQEEPEDKNPYFSYGCLILDLMRHLVNRWFRLTHACHCVTITSRWTVIYVTQNAGHPANIKATHCMQRPSTTSDSHALTACHHSSLWLIIGYGISVIGYD